MNKYLVSFTNNGSNFYQSNIAIAESMQAVLEHYENAGKENIYITEANDGTIAEAERKGKPFVTIEPKQEEEQAQTYGDKVQEIIDLFENNDEIFIELVEELDNWNGFADGFRAYEMCELDELFSGCTVSQFLDKLGRDFNHNDDYFVDTIYGLESFNGSKADHYHDNVSAGELFDNVSEQFSNIYIPDEVKALFDELEELAAQA